MKLHKKTQKSKQQTRIAIVSEKRCKPDKCGLECKRNCPVNRQGKHCIQVSKKSKISSISEILCIGCNICVKRCPFDAIQIINLPKDLDSHTTHRFGPNSFKLHRLPLPRQSKILGLVGSNGIGKSTALKILNGKIKPNLGDYSTPPTWEFIRKRFKGSQLQTYFKRILEEDLSTAMKPQNVDYIPRAKLFRKPGITVQKCLSKHDERGCLNIIIKQLDLTNILNREICNLSGGELQRFAIAACCIQEKDVYMFDEPSSYLDVKQRLNAAKVIRNLVSVKEEFRRSKKYGKLKGVYVIVVEHDLAVLDYLSDYVCMFYGTPTVYGVVTNPFGVREGINVFLSGFIPTENMRFRDFALDFKIALQDNTVDDEKISMNNSQQKPKINKKNLNEKEDKNGNYYRYPTMTKSFPSYELKIEPGYFRDSQITVMLGENGTGKTTFVKLLAGLLKPNEKYVKIPKLTVSYKPQKICPTKAISVKTLFMKRIRGMCQNPQFISDVIKPMKVMELYDKIVTKLSGGELQRVSIVLCLGSVADVYLIDEPSAYLDSEQRVITAKVIKRFILHNKKCAFIVEHDFIMASYLGDRVIVFEGIPAVNTIALKPMSLVNGMNKFLCNLGITFRRDPMNGRPRINKIGGSRDREQKKSGNYFFVGQSN